MTTDEELRAAVEAEVPTGQLEVRGLPGVEHLEARAATDDEGPGIVGYGSVYEVRTTIPGYFRDWDEEVARGAWTKTIQEGDIRSMFNHDDNWLLGRTSADTLSLSEDDTGLRYEVDINPDDPNAMSVHAKVERGDVSGSSVWFRVIRHEIEIPSDDNDLERPLRRILEAALYETGPVVWPAFEATTAGARSLGALDGALRAIGVDGRAKRASLVADLLADPDSVEQELRDLLHAQLVAAGNGGTNPDAPPPVAPVRSGAPPELGHPPIEDHIRWARGFAARSGLTIPKGT